MIQFVPKEFQPTTYPVYPPDNVPDFEHWLADNINPEALSATGRVYLPVCWTSFYCNANYGKKTLSMLALNQWLKKLDRTKKYWTVVQYDDGILSKIDHLDILVFGMSGMGAHHAIPLLCKPHKFQKMPGKSYLASFSGAMTHQLRYDMINALKHREEIFMTTRRLSSQRFMDLLSHSTYTLCPRGYGATSFRIMEAIHAGSIPVYISDVFVEPFGIDFDSYGIKITPEQIPDLFNILTSPETESKRLWRQQNAKLFRHLFTFEGCKTEIIKTLSYADKVPI